MDNEFPFDRTYDPPTQQLGEYFNGHRSRRDFLQVGGLGLGGFVLGVGATAPNCGGKSAAGAIAIILGSITDLKGVFPNLPILDKVTTLAKDFNEAWMAGKFDSARTFFDNLDSTITLVITDLGVNASTNIKLALAALKIGLRAVAALIDAQGTQQPQIAARAGTVAPQTVSRVRQLANAGDADWILRAVQK